MRDCRVLDSVPPNDTAEGEDARGSFVQLHNGLHRILYVNNPERHTLRGLHFQRPFKSKSITCVEGCIFDVLVDLREDSSTYMRWSEIVLKKGDSIFVPEGMAHGYITIVPNTSLIYVLDGHENDNQGLRWNDPKLDISWPAQPKLISDRDNQWRYL